MLKNYQKKKGKDRNLYLLKSLQDLHLITNFDEKTCGHCQTACTVHDDFEATSPKLHCLCGRLSVNPMEGSIFQKGSLSIIDQIRIIKGFMSGLTSYSVWKNCGINERSIRNYFTHLHERLNFFVTRQTEICVKTIFSSDFVEKSFVVDRCSLDFSKDQDCESAILGGIMERHSQKVVFKVFTENDDDKDYCNWIKEIIPKNYLEKLTFLSTKSTEQKTIAKNFKNPSFGENSKQAKSELVLSSLFSLIQSQRNQKKGKKTESSLHKAVDSVVFKTNGWSSFLQLFQINNEKEYKQFKPASNEMDVSSEESDVASPKPRKANEIPVLSRRLIKTGSSAALFSADKKVSVFAYLLVNNPLISLF
jgi:hypothetical protein